MVCDQKYNTNLYEFNQNLYEFVIPHYFFPSSFDCTMNWFPFHFVLIGRRRGSCWKTCTRISSSTRTQKNANTWRWWREWSM